MPQIEIRKIVTVSEEIRGEAGRSADKPLRRAAAMAVVSNPYAGRYQDDLSELVRFSGELGAMLGARAVEALQAPAESYGKGAIAGVAGEQEHANAFLTTIFGDALREAVGGGKAWISSTTKVGALGASLDVPLAHKDALYVRSHYDTFEVRVPDAPRPDEVVVVVVVASGARLNERLGGLRKDDIQGVDGLR